MTIRLVALLAALEDHLQATRTYAMERECMLVALEIDVALQLAIAAHAQAQLLVETANRVDGAVSQ